MVQKNIKNEFIKFSVKKGKKEKQEKNFLFFLFRLKIEKKVYPEKIFKTVLKRLSIKTKHVKNSKTSFLVKPNPVQKQNCFANKMLHKENNLISTVSEVYYYKKGEIIEKRKQFYKEMKSFFV